jgi:hypothetical protein
MKGQYEGIVSFQIDLGTNGITHTNDLTTGFQLGFGK